MANILENQLAGLTQVIEKQLDEQLERFDNLDKDDLKAIREQRLKEMKELNLKKQEWIKNVSNDLYNKFMNNSNYSRILTLGKILLRNLEFLAN